MIMTYKEIKTIHDRNKLSNNNTYIVPVSSFDMFIRDELMFVKLSDSMSCTVFRAMDGKLYNLSTSQIKKFKCVGNC